LVDTATTIGRQRYTDGGSVKEFTPEEVDRFAILAELLNPQRQSAILSEQIPRDEAIRKITGKRIDRARKHFDKFLEVLPTFGDPRIPLIRFGKPKDGEPQKYALALYGKTMPVAIVEILSQYYRRWQELVVSERNRVNGRKTQFQKKISKT